MTKIPTKEEIEAAELALAVLLEVADQLANRGGSGVKFTPTAMLGILSTAAARWAKRHHIAPDRYAKIQNELLGTMTGEK